MKQYFIILTVLFVFGCNSKTSENKVEDEKTSPTIIIQQNHSAQYIRGYNDGYSGNWLAPGSWFVLNEYRAGWSAGEKDKKNNVPHKFGS